MAYKDYRDLIRHMEREMQQLSDEAFRNLFAVPMGGGGRFWQPPVDVHETESAVVVKMELAGVRADEILVSLAPDARSVTISGTRGESYTDRDGRVRCHQLEIYFGPFERTVALPSNVELDRDAVTATYRDGFLQIAIPRKPVRKDAGRRRVIPITNHDEEKAQAATPAPERESEGED
jgi:HSP20 family protein